MDFKEILKERIHPYDIRRICEVCRGAWGDLRKEELFLLAKDSDNRISYNALWVFTYFSPYERKWLESRRNDLIDWLLATAHTGKRRLILTLLERQKVGREDIRTDYLDFCLSGINSTEPYGIRALCIKQAFAQCRHYPELLQELKSEIEMMDYGELSPGLVSARKNISKKIAKLGI